MPELRHAPLQQSLQDEHGHCRSNTRKPEVVAQSNDRSKNRVK